MQGNVVPILWMTSCFHIIVHVHGSATVVIDPLFAISSQLAATDFIGWRGGHPYYGASAKSAGSDCRGYARVTSNKGKFYFIGDSLATLMRDATLVRHML